MPQDDNTHDSDFQADTLNLARLGEIIELVPVAMFVKLEDGNHLFCNEPYLQILHVTREQVIGRKIEDFAPLGVIQNAVVKDQLLKQSEFLGTLAYRISFTDFQGNERYVDVTKCALPFKHQGQNIITGCVIDVSEAVRYRNELSNQHAFLRMVIDNLPQLIYTKDLESHFTLANKTLAMLLTGEPDSARLIGKSDSDFFRPGLWVKYYNDEQEVMHTDKPMVNIIELCEDKTGHRRWNNTTKLPLHDDKGKVIGLIGIGSDFTQFKKSEEQLRLQATALETAADGIVIADRQGVMIWANTAMTNISGYGMAEIIGANPRIFKSGCQTQEFYRQMWRTITSGQSWKGELINRRKDGLLRTEEITITPVPNETGRITHFVSICRDVTERQLLRQEMSRIYAAVSGAKDGILLLSRNNKPLFINKAFTSLLGYTMNELPAEIIATITRVDDEALNDKGSSDTRIRQDELLSLDGDPIPVEIRDWPVIGDDNAFLGQVYFLRDLRDELRLADAEKMMEIRLRQAQKMEAIGQLAAGIAHEINNPIQFVGNNTTFLKTTFADLTRLVEAQRQAIEKAGTSIDTSEIENLKNEIDYEYLKTEVPQAMEQTLDGIRRVTEIVKAMKDFSHPGSKNRQSMDINKAVNDALLVAKNEWKYNADVETELAPDLPHALCLTNEMNQAILNILVNAAHAVTDAVTKGFRKRGLIKIKTEHDAKEVRILIIDNGTGIPKSIQNRIFEPFFTTKEVGKGTGQGLTIAYDVVVHKHGGSLTFKSIENEGTTFTIAIPLNAKTEIDK
jgi:two-component system, NtrC family, sensor kinase